MKLIDKLQKMGTPGFTLSTEQLTEIRKIAENGSDLAVKFLRLLEIEQLGEKKYVLVLVAAYGKGIFSEEYEASDFDIYAEFLEQELLYAREKASKSPIEDRSRSAGR